MEETSQRSGADNLRRDFTHEERVENGRKGGIASGQARRRMKTFRETLRAFLDCELSDEGQREVLEALGFAPTYMNQINLTHIRKAAEGGLDAARFIRDTLGEKPGDGAGDPADKPLACLDMSGLSDEELRVLAARKGGTPETQ